MTRRVLIVSPHFPPDSTAGTHRVRLLAPHLAKHGWEPTVLTIDPRDYEGRLGPVLAESVPSDLRVVRARAWPAGVSRRFGLGDLGLRGFEGLLRTSSRLLAAERFDALFVTIYPTYPALLGPLLKKRFGVPFVLDYQDPWVGEWGRTAGPGPDGRPDLKSRTTRIAATWLEPFALRAADAVTAVSRATYEQAFARTRNAAPRVAEELPIGWDDRDFAFLRQRDGGSPLGPPADGMVHVSYVGTLLPTGIDTLRAVLRAVAQLRARTPAAARLCLHFFGTSNQRSVGTPPRVLPIAQELGVADLVTEQPDRLDYFDALRTLMTSTAILLIGSRERHYTPSKAFPALLAGRPLLAVYHVDSTVTGLLRRYGRPPAVRLVTYDDERPALARVDEITAQLCDLVRDPAYHAECVDAGVLDGTSARAVAGRLAAVLDEVTR